MNALATVSASSAVLAANQAWTTASWPPVAVLLAPGERRDGR